VIEHALDGIVLTAQTFNPSIFTETWLQKNGILDVSKLAGARVFSAQVVQFQTEDVQVMVVPPQLQITFSDKAADVELPRSIASRVVELLPHTPYQALGINFTYFVSPPAGQEFIAYDRALFGTGECALLREFSAADARFGRYFSKDLGSARLRLDIKPVKAGPKNADMFAFAFNFHHDLAGIEQSDRAKSLIKFIGTWNSLREYAEKLTEVGSKLGGQGRA